MKDDKMKKLIKDNLDKELNNITFSEERKNIVLDRIVTPKSLLKKFLDYEITIPLKPVVAITTAFFIGVGYMFYPVVKIDEEDILNSKIEVVYLVEGR